MRIDKVLMSRLNNIPGCINRKKGDTQYEVHSGTIQQAVLWNNWRVQQRSVEEAAVTWTEATTELRQWI